MSSFPATYEESGQIFRSSLPRVQKVWPAARMESRPLAAEPELSLDWIAAEATKEKQRLLMLISGEHGVEGYVGAALTQLFLDEYLPGLEPSTTGLLVIHAINPWGMKHRRRVNEANIDLNRSFLTDFRSPALANPDYEMLFRLLNPSRPLRAVPFAIAGFVVSAVSNLARYGMTRLREATLRGQFNHPEGIYYGGNELQQETRTMMELFEQYIGSYGQMLSIDLHTGYGPARSMTLVASAQEKMTSAEMKAKFNLPLVVAANPDEFYTMNGDMNEYLYTLMKTEFPGKPFFAATCEFGTFGDSIPAVIRSLYTSVFENQFHQHGGSNAARIWMEREYTELFAPTDPQWFEQAQADARQAFTGLLKAEGYIG